MTIKVIFHKADEGGYWAEVPALRGCVSKGETIEDTQNNIKEAIEAFLEISDGEIVVEAYDKVVELAV